MRVKPRPPILPRSKEDPTGVDKLERGAMREFKRRIRLITKGYIALLNRIPVEPVVNKRYAFQLDPVLLSALLGEGGSLIDSILLEGGEHGLWLFESYVAVAYARGTAQEFASLGQQSPAYKAGQQDLGTIFRSEPYQRRIALIRAREFEEMQGATGKMKANMGRILTDGIGRGLNPRDIARNLTEGAGMSLRDANRIARTEVTTALRRARLDESDEAQERYGLRMKQMHMSALLPTTRRTHAERHAKLYTSDEQRDWWSKDGNSINCRCSSVSVLVDDKGKPLVPGIQQRARATYTKMAERDDSKWK